ncbi:hypothetical protein LOK49_LG11G00683 [Camellia lanceoleosa]|uniref:Uncharacterized protein n=1 Tax=Camellia lanceoleosa TaxID=1840588 RepID=A0ACC0G2R4_9ERIC|nr:hypothetical protein LOK49_LG11G00683 [Camellia lanceoleosa]
MHWKSFSGPNALYKLLVKGDAEGTCSVMKYFHGQDQSNCSSKQVNDRFVAEAASLSPSRIVLMSVSLLFVSLYFSFTISFAILVKYGILSGTKRYLELHTTEPPIEFHEEETRIRYAMPRLDQQKNKGEISVREKPNLLESSVACYLYHHTPSDKCETMQSADDQVISCSLSKQKHDAFIQETSTLSSLGVWHILWTLMKRRELSVHLKVTGTAHIVEINLVLGENLLESPQIQEDIL